MQVFQLLSLLCAVALSWAYPSGPPTAVCGDMYPVGHAVDAQTSATPYTITVNGSQYTAGGALEITLSGSRNFTGVFLQARSLLNCSDVTPLGTFTLASGDTLLKYLTCSSVQNGAVSHTSSASKMSHTVTWNAPAQSVGHLYFRATFIDSTTVFWTTTMSDFITDTTDSSALPSAACEVRTTISGNSNGNGSGNSAPSVVFHLLMTAVMCLLSVMV